MEGLEIFREGFVEVQALGGEGRLVAAVDIAGGRWSCIIFRNFDLKSGLYEVILFIDVGNG